MLNLPPQTHSFKMKKKTILFLGLLSTSLQAQNIGWLQGEWEGVGYQLSNGGTWTMSVTANIANYSIAIRYPSLDCGGVWMIRSSSDCSIELVEDIEYGEDKCLDGGFVVLTRVDADHVTFTYFLSGTRTMDAYATLRRIR